jgi:hypothetical protein
VAARLKVAAGRIGASRARGEIPKTSSLQRRDRYAIFCTVCTFESYCALRGWEPRMARIGADGGRDELMKQSVGCMRPPRPKCTSPHRCPSPPGPLPRGERVHCASACAHYGCPLAQCCARRGITFHNPPYIKKMANNSPPKRARIPGKHVRIQPARHAFLSRHPAGWKALRKGRAARGTSRPPGRDRRRALTSGRSSGSAEAFGSYAEPRKFPRIAHARKLLPAREKGRNSLSGRRLRETCAATCARETSRTCAGELARTQEEWCNAPAAGLCTLRTW